jgi:hypothetical protein
MSNEDVKFVAGALWGAALVLGGWLICMIMEGLPRPYSLFLILPLFIWVMTWAYSDKTRDWAVRFVVAGRKR